MKLAKSIALLICFCLDVHVRAEPCGAPPCQLKSEQVSVHAATGIVVGPNGLISWEAPARVRLVQGKMLLNQPGAFVTPFATFTCAGECRALVVREPVRVRLSTLKGAWRVERRGDATLYAVPEATQVVVGEVEGSGKAQLELPQALPWKPVVKAWGQLYRGPAAEFKAQVSEFHDAWTEAVEHLAETQEQLARAEVDQAAQAAHRAFMVKRAREAEDAELRARFRRQNFPGTDL